MSENSNMRPDEAGAAGAAEPAAQPSTTPGPEQAPAAAQTASAAAAEWQAPGASAAQPEPQPQPAAPQAPTATPGSAAPPTAADPAWQAPAEDAWAAGTDQPPSGPGTGVAATFLPGIEAGALIALALSLIGAGVYLLVYPLVQAHNAHHTWTDFKNNVPRTQQDPFAMERDWVSYQAWGHIIIGLVAVLVALLILAFWNVERNKLWARAAAQAALVIGLCVVLYGILLKTGVVGSSIPSLKEIRNNLAVAR